MLRRTLPRKHNGNAGPGRPNGHGPDSVPACDAGLAPTSHAPTPGREGGGVPVSACPCPAGGHRDHAASDDASGIPVACAPASAVASLPSQASTGREAYAAAAPPPSHDASRVAQQGTSEPAGEDHDEIPPGEMPLPSNAGDFVEEIHSRIDLFEVWQKLLRSKDDKIRQRAVERLTDLRYKGTATSGEEPQQFIFDLPRPKRD